MTEPESQFGFPERLTGTDKDHEKAVKVAGAINALRTTLPNGGWLSILVWNTRNSYLTWPESSFPALHMQMLVEGFLEEVESLKAQLPGAPEATSRG